MRFAKSCVLAAGLCLTSSACATPDIVYMPTRTEEALRVCEPHFAEVVTQAEEQQMSAALVYVLPLEAPGSANFIEQRFVTLRVLAQYGPTVPTAGIVHVPDLLDASGHVYPRSQVMPASVGVVLLEERDHRLWSVLFLTCEGLVEFEDGT